LNEIYKQFEKWLSKYENSYGDAKDTYQQRLYGFVIGLKLSGNENDFKKYKEIYDKVVHGIHADY